MDSINNRQAEDNRENLNGIEAIEKVRELLDKSSSCFFCTSIPLGNSAGCRPMSVQKMDDEGNLWFLSANDSYKNREISADPTVKLYFQGSAHSDFMNLHGIASISEDKEKIHELWEPIMKTWFTEGEDDPRISVIKVKPMAGYYWDNKHGNAVAGIKMMIGAVLGKTIDVSIEGRLEV